MRPNAVAVSDVFAFATLLCRELNRDPFGGVLAVAGLLQANCGILHSELVVDLQVSVTSIRHYYVNLRYEEHGN